MPEKTMPDESEKKLDIVFTGNIASDAVLSTVKAKATQLFRLDDAKLAALFSGKRTMLKKNIDNVAAQKYQKALSGIGMITVLQVHGDAQIKKPPTSVQLPPAEVRLSAAADSSPQTQAIVAKIASAPELSSQQWDVLPAGEVGKIDDSLSLSQHHSVSKKSDWTIDELGVQLSESQENILEKMENDIALANITIAPPASDLLNEDEKQEVPAPRDFSVIETVTVTSAGEDLLAEEEKVEWAELPMDLAHLKAEHVNGDLLANHEKRIFVEASVNIDNIHLENT